MQGTRPASSSALPKPDRRTLLGSAGLAAVVLASGTAAASVTAADDAEAQLVAGLGLLRKLDEAYAETGSPLFELEGVFIAGRPPRALEQRWRWSHGFSHGHATYNEPDGKRYSFIPDEDIERLRTHVVPRTGRLIDDDDMAASGADCPRVLVHGGSDLPLTAKGKRAWAEQDDHGRVAAARVLAAYDAWRAECDAYAAEIGLTAARRAYAAARKAYTDEIVRLLALPVTTLRGFACKARVLTWFCQDEDDTTTLLEELSELAPHPNSV